MAGHGRAPKLPSERRNRTPPARGEWVDLPPLEAPILPELPSITEDGEPWQPRTVALWNAWRQDPVTAMWSPADLAMARDTIGFHNVCVPGQRGSITLATEVRLRMDGLGLTPKGRRDLRWKVVADGEEEEGSRRAHSRSLDREKRRQKLSVVK